jgi:hypothetical protein
MKVYRIRDWATHFENNRTRELKKMDWVPVPNRHDGDGFTELLDHKNGMAHYGAWHLILQVASKCDPRGTLLRDGAGGGKIPHSAESLSRITHGKVTVFEEAITRLLSIGWLESYDNPAPSCGNPAPCCGEVTTERNGTEGNGKERKGRERKGNESYGGTETEEEEVAATDSVSSKNFLERDYSEVKPREIGSYEDLHAIADPIEAAISLTKETDIRAWGEKRQRASWPLECYGLKPAPPHPWG